MSKEKLTGVHELYAKYRMGCGQTINLSPIKFSWAMNDFWSLVIEGGWGFPQGILKEIQNWCEERHWAFLSP